MRHDGLVYIRYQAGFVHAGFNLWLRRSVTPAAQLFLTCR
jgi:hypothetical protein